jgi:hypothetical protein
MFVRAVAAAAVMATALAIPACCQITNRVALERNFSVVVTGNWFAGSNNEISPI